MHRTEGADFVSVGGENFFQDGPPGTVVTSSWLNAVQEEIISVLEEASVVPQTAATETRDQLITALKILFVEPDAVETLTNKTINSDSNTITLDSNDAGLTFTLDTNDAGTDVTIDSGDTDTAITLDSADSGLALAVDTSNAGTSLTLDTNDAGTDITIDSGDTNTAVTLDSSDASLTLDIDSSQGGTTVAVDSTTDFVSGSFASQAENIAGTVSNKIVTPLGVREAFNSTGTAPVFAIRAWANLNGRDASPITPSASGNIASITTSAAGVFDLTFTTNMPDTNYGVVVTGTGIGSGGTVVGGIRVASPGSGTTLKTVSTFQIVLRRSDSDAAADPDDLTIIVIR